jgi:hypothetical protein
MFENRGIWVSAVESGALPPALPSSPFDDADPSPTASTGKAALAYAAEPAASARVPLPRPAKARPMGSTIPQLPATASLLAPTAQAVATMMSTELTSGGQRSDSPWLRAAILTPSISGFMTASRMGEQNLTPLVSLMHKPDQSLVMTFSADPHLGMVADRFTGRAVEFLATATFTTQTTASLR